MELMLYLDFRCVAVAFPQGWIWCHDRVGSGLWLLSGVAVCLGSVLQVGAFAGGGGGIGGSGMLGACGSEVGLGEWPRC